MSTNVLKYRIKEKLGKKGKKQRREKETKSLRYIRRKWKKTIKRKLKRKNENTAPFLKHSIIILIILKILKGD